MAGQKLWENEPRPTSWRRRRIIGGTLLSLLGANPINLLVVVAVVNGAAAAPFLLVAMLVSNNRQLMGQHANGHLARPLGWITTITMDAASLALRATSL